jgi:hypothetical protein
MDQKLRASPIHADLGTTNDDEAYVLYHRRPEPGGTKRRKFVYEKKKDANQALPVLYV